MTPAVWVVLAVAGYLAVVVAGWVKVAADYRYDMIRDLNGGDWKYRSMRDNDRGERRFLLSFWCLVWPTYFPYLAVKALFTAAGTIGERRAAREDAAVDQLKQQALDAKHARDLFQPDTDEYRVLDQIAVEARARWQAASR